MSEDAHPCPQCGSELYRCQDDIGVTYQCAHLDCLGLFDEGEILEKEQPHE